MWKEDKNRAAKRERIRSTVIYSEETSSFWQEEDENIKMGIASNKIVMMPMGNTAIASEKGLLPN